MEFNHFLFVISLHTAKPLKKKKKKKADISIIVVSSPVFQVLLQEDQGSSQEKEKDR